MECFLCNLGVKKPYSTIFWFDVLEVGGAPLSSLKFLFDEWGDCFVELDHGGELGELALDVEKLFHFLLLDFSELGLVDGDEMDLELEERGTFW